MIHLVPVSIIFVNMLIIGGSSGYILKVHGGNQQRPTKMQCGNISKKNAILRISAILKACKIGQDKNVFFLVLKGIYSFTQSTF